MCQLLIWFISALSHSEFFEIRGSQLRHLLSPSIIYEKRGWTLSTQYIVLIL